MKLVLTPTDTFFFRNHKAMNAGADFFASGLFPPRPGTVYGALRSAYIHAKSDFAAFAAGSDEELSKWMGTPSSYGKFAIKGVVLQDEQDMALPLPLDHQVVLGISGSATAKRLRLKYEPEKEVFGSDRCPYRLYGVSEEKSASASGRFVYRQDFVKALLQPVDLEVHSASRWVISEQRVGIAMDRVAKKAQQSMFYSMEALRFRDENGTAIAAICDSENTPDFSGVTLASLGAKQRPWSLKVERNTDLGVTKEEIVGAIEKSGIARIILLTSALWKHGTRPECWDGERNVLLINGRLYPVLAAAIGRPLIEGGWDIVRNRPKPRFHAVPAGSVLYVKVASGDADNLVASIHETNFTDSSAQEGYGFAVVGAGFLNQ